MPDLFARLRDGFRTAFLHVPLAAVPAVVALVAFTRVRRAASFDGVHVGITVGFPAGVVDAWNFVSLPTPGGVDVGVGSVLVLVVATLIRGVLAAGYFGSIRNLLAGENWEFLRNAGRYLPQFLGLAAVGAVIVLALGGVLIAISPVLSILAVPVVLAGGYLFYAVPYLIVLRDLGLVEAARESYRLATSRRAYAAYGVGYAIVVAVVSPFASSLVVTGRVPGIAIGILALSPVGLALNVATMRFVADLDERSPDLGTWDEGSGADGPGGDPVGGPSVEGRDEEQPDHDGAVD